MKKSDLIAFLRNIGIKANAKDYQQYEMAKQRIIRLVNNSTEYDQAVRWAAEYCGV
jgi:hypothetical protein